MSTNQPEPQMTYRSPDDQPVTAGQLRWYLQGLRHARLATVFGVLGIFTLGVVFGPLAMIEARKAESFGVPAPEGKVLGWVAIGLFITWAVFFIGYLALIMATVGNLPHSARVTGA